MFPDIVLESDLKNKKKEKTPTTTCKISKSVPNKPNNLNMDDGKNQKANDSKLRLRWSTGELHHRFIEAVNQIGGPQKATPKGLMRIMKVPELTLYHLKSHNLQRYRLGKSDNFVGNKQDVSPAAKTQEGLSKKDSGDQLDIIVTDKNDDRYNGNLQIKEAIEIQLEVQKKLHEQIEVQKQLQVRIEAQAKYLQSVLMKAQETLSGYSSSNLGIEFKRPELYGVASMANRSCLSSSFSELTQADEEGEEGFLESKKSVNIGIRQTRSSVDSSLTSSESSEAKADCDSQSVTRRSIELQLMEIKPEKVTGAEEEKVERSIRKRAFGGHDGEDF